MNDNESSAPIKGNDSALVEDASCCFESIIVNEGTTSGIIEHMLTQEMGITPALSQVRIFCGYIWSLRDL